MIIVVNGGKRVSYFTILLLCYYYIQPRTNTADLRPGGVAQSVTCLVTDAKLTADPGVASSIPARSHTSWRLIMK